MDVLFDLKPFVGSKVSLETQDESFIGILSFVDSGTTKIGLSDVKILPSQESLIGLQVFYSVDIINYKIIDEKKQLRSKVESTNKSNHFPIKQNDFSGFIFNSELSEEEEENQSTCDVDDTEEEFVLELPEALKDYLPQDHMFINSCDESFHEAIKDILNESVIGVSFEGKNINRYGEISIISISTEVTTFLFDISTMKDEAFRKGLKGIFESPNIQKVIHDCRYASDALFHLYKTKLICVFDTMVSHLFIREVHRRNTKLQQYEWDVMWCLQHYLELARGEFCVTRRNFSALKKMADWTYRPLSNALHDLAIHKVIYLRLLREACLSRMLDEFCKVVDIFNEVVRDRTEKELQLQETDFDFLPMRYAGASVKIIQVSKYFRGDRKNPFGDILNKMCGNILETPERNSVETPNNECSHERFFVSPRAFSSKESNSQDKSRYTMPLTPDKSPSNNNVEKNAPSFNDHSISSFLQNGDNSHFYKSSFLNKLRKNYSEINNDFNEVISSDESEFSSIKKEEYEHSLKEKPSDRHVTFVPAGKRLNDELNGQFHRKLNLHNTMNQRNGTVNTNFRNQIITVTKDFSPNSERDISVNEDSYLSDESISSVEKTSTKRTKLPIVTLKSHSNRIFGIKQNVPDSILERSEQLSKMNEVDNKQPKSQSANIHQEISSINKDMRNTSTSKETANGYNDKFEEYSWPRETKEFTKHVSFLPAGML